MRSLPPGGCCKVCQMVPAQVYRLRSSLPELHLDIPPDALDGGRKPDAANGLTVCPMYHAALHAYRPRLARATCTDIL